MSVCLAAAAAVAAAAAASVATHWVFTILLISAFSTTQNWRKKLDFKNKHMKNTQHASQMKIYWIVFTQYSRFSFLFLLIVSALTHDIIHYCLVLNEHSQLFSGVDRFFLTFPFSHSKSVSVWMCESAHWMTERVHFIYNVKIFLTRNMHTESAQWGCARRFMCGCLATATDGWLLVAAVAAVTADALLRNECAQDTKHTSVRVVGGRRALYPIHAYCIHIYRMDRRRHTYMRARTDVNADENFLLFSWHRRF